VLGTAINRLQDIIAHSSCGRKVEDREADHLDSEIGGIVAASTTQQGLDISKGRRSSRGVDKGLVVAEEVLLGPDRLATVAKGLDRSDGSRSWRGEEGKCLVDSEVIRLGPDHLTTARLDMNRVLRSQASHESSVRKGWPAVCRRAEGDATQEEEQHEV
jgi:hypothetical protein